MSSIHLHSVSKHYGAVAAVDDVSLDVAQGEFVTILGPSGSGKTTILTMIAGLNHPSGGSIHIGGRDVTALPASQRNIGLVFQSYALFPHMNVFDNVAFPLSVRKFGARETRERVEEALARVRLEGFERRKPSQLSGGQQQRVALARAIVFKPDILLLDEPLGALDRKLREEVQVELRRLQRSLGITTILVTHDQEEALSLSDRIMVLDHGRVQQIAAPQEAYLRPSNRFVADFLGTANFLEGRIGSGSRSILLGSGQAIPCGPSALPEGARVTAILRPERLALAPHGPDGMLAATVSEAVYLGQSVRYHVETPSGPMVAVAPGGRGGFAAGAQVSVSWQAEDVWIIPDDGSTPG
ncbi:ABC transporter ATP-binding protein [Roseomonas oryzicola]|uniref:ABC transporter ATP-binding protein n=1 Tax=Neoroseomonas oryzicola TaxID=535904 RepID=A0A9X9WJW2_9PROT|nr:ABC transporter ATP-binding protein [Neoroseomonas oryzicola]NKE20019.1 ABC transporter ATP-binding protein [Neoroseomonas oryzicola]